MKERPPRISREEMYRRELARSEARLKELEEGGAASLSRYDIEIAAGGDADLALRTARFLVGNHVKYFKLQLGIEEEKPRQPRLFDF
jgi:hypothetical protein